MIKLSDAFRRLTAVCEEKENDRGKCNWSNVVRHFDLVAIFADSP